MSSISSAPLVSRLGFPFAPTVTKVMFLLSVGVTEAWRWHRFHLFLSLRGLGHERLNCCHPICWLRQRLSWCGGESSGSMTALDSMRGILHYCKTVTLSRRIVFYRNNSDGMSSNPSKAGPYIWKY